MVKVEVDVIRKTTFEFVVDAVLDSDGDIDVENLYRTCKGSIYFIWSTELIIKRTARGNKWTKDKRINFIKQ